MTVYNYTHTSFFKILLKHFYCPYNFSASKYPQTSTFVPGKWELFKTEVFFLKRKYNVRIFGDIFSLFKYNNVSIYKQDKDVGFVQGTCSINLNIYALI